MFRHPHSPEWFRICHRSTRQHSHADSPTCSHASQTNGENPVTYRRVGSRRITFPAERRRAISAAVRTVILWIYEDCLYSLRRGTFAERHGVWRAFQGAVQVLEVR